MNLYEKKYKEALELARVAAFNGHQSLMEGIFPELKEGEDERIKKEIISFIQDAIDEINLKVSGDYDDRDEDDIAHQNWCKKAIAWLENIPYTIDHEKREGFHLGYKTALEKQGEKSQRMVSAEAKEAMYSKPAWSNWDLKAQSKDMIEALRTEYEKGRADVIADILSWLENCWPRYCSNQTIIEGFKEAMKE